MSGMGWFCYSFKNSKCTFLILVGPFDTVSSPNLVDCRNLYCCHFYIVFLHLHIVCLLLFFWLDYLIVDESPLLQESMAPHDGANISSKISSTSCWRQILCWVESIRVDHKVSVGEINLWSLATIFVVEKLRQMSLFNAVNAVIIKPSWVTWNNDVMSLFGHIFTIIFLFFLCFSIRVITRTT